MPPDAIALSRTTRSRPVKLTTKALQAAEEAAAEKAAPAATQSKKAKSKSSKIKKAAGAQLSRSEVENHSVSGSSPTPKYHGEATTLSANRTSNRAVSTIRLNANSNGIPKPPAAAREPARVVGGHRLPAPLSKPAARRLSAENAARLQALRSPFAPPGHAGRQAGSSGSRGIDQADPSASRPPANPAPRQAPPTRSEKPPPATPRPSQPPLGDVGVRAANQPNPFRNPPSMPRDREVQAPQDARTLFDAPLHEPTGVTEGQDDEEYTNPRFNAMEGISRTPCGMEMGQLPRVRAALPVMNMHGKVDLYDDYASQPRAIAYAQAFNPQLPAEELQEFEDDPEAMEDEDLADDLRYSASYQEHDSHDTRSERAGSVRPRAALDDESEDDQPAHRRPRLESEEPASDDSGNLAEPELNNNLVGRKAPLRGDYVEAVKEVLGRAVTLYKTQLSSENAYPDTLTARTWAKTAWKQAAVELDLPLKYHSSIIPLITRYSWNLRSELKTAARSLVQGMYGFKPASADDVEWVEFNKDRARALLTDKAFAYEDPGTDKGLYQVCIIQAVVNRVYYKGPTDDGVIHDNIYRPFPLKAVALVLTAIQCAIQEWEPGTFSNVNFNQLAYSTVYEKHVTDLQNFEKKGIMMFNDVLAKLRTKLSERGRAHAKSPIEQYASSGGISDAQMDRALAAYLQDGQ